MRSPILPSKPPLVDPATGRRFLRRPDLRGLWTPEPSGAPLTADEVDFDEVVIHRSWRSFAPDAPGEVRYFMVEFSQRNPGTDVWMSAVKAVRFVRLTRVPRYLRAASSIGSQALVFAQQQDLLAALREQQVLFVNLIAKSPELPLVFAYGVQAVGASAAEAQAKCDEAYEVLTRQLDGTYQQLQYAALTMPEAETIARHQAEWSHVAAGRGRPLPQGVALGTSGILDGNRTDVEQANQQLESFIRGMNDRSFMLSLITVPLSPAEISVAWRNITTKLSDVRSEQTGSRSVTAGIALPLSLGHAMGNSHGTTHQSGSSEGTSTTDTVSESLAHGTSSSVTNTEGVNQSSSLADGVSRTDTRTDGTNSGTSTAATDSTATTASTSRSETDGTNWSTTETEGTSRSNTEGRAVTNTTGSSASSGWSSSSSVTSGSSVTDTSGTNSSQTNGNSVGGGVIINGGSSTSGTDGVSNSTASQTSYSESTVSGSSGSSSYSESRGVTNSSSSTVGTSQSTSESTGGSRSVGTTTGTSDTTGRATTAGTNQGVSASDATSNGTSRTSTNTSGTSSSVANATGVNETKTSGTSQANGSNQSLNDAYAVAMNRVSTATGTLGAVPSFGITTSKVTEDVGKRVVGDILEAQMRRYLEGVESGAFLYQMFLVCPDRATLVGGAGLLKSAFWGAKAADPSARLPQPFHVVSNFEPDEAERIRAHAQLLTSYRKREDRTELIEPFKYSTYITPGELATFCHPPTSEALGLLAVHDSMPVMAMPSDRGEREMRLGHVIDGERGRVSEQGFGLDVSEIKSHALIAGVSGSGKTTTLLRLMYEAAQVRRKLLIPPTPANPVAQERTIPAGILAIDWMRNLRSLVQVVEPDRFRFWSVARPDLGAFRWNPLAVPDNGMDPADWAALQADNFVAAMNLGEFGRALISELVDDLYRANRLEDVVLRPEVRDVNGQIVAPAQILPALDPATLPAGAIQLSPDGVEVANVYTCPELSRTVGMEHLAILVLAKSEELATPEGARLYGTAMRDRIQSLYRRIQYYLPGQKLAEMLTYDPSLDVRVCLTVKDLVDPDRGLVSVLETDGLDMANRRLVIGSVILAVYRVGLHHGEGTFDHNGEGPGTFVVLEEAHELLGERGQDEDQASASTRIALWSSFFRRARALGLRGIVVAQNPGDLDESITSNTSSVFIHRCYADNDRKRVFSLLNWAFQIGQQQREWRYLGEMPTGYCIARLDARTSWLESAPVQFLTDPPPVGKLTDDQMAAWVARLPH